MSEITKLFSYSWTIQVVYSFLLLLATMKCASSCIPIFVYYYSFGEPFFIDKFQGEGLLRKMYEHFYFVKLIERMYLSFF